jgi:hypothetical protein
MSSAAALLLLPLLAAAGDGAACPTPPAAAVILRHASTSCRTVDALGLRGHRAGVVEVGFALPFDLAVTLAENWRPVACAVRLPFGAREFKYFMSFWFYPPL